jgi:adenosylhomocysteine nucleosidase
MRTAIVSAMHQELAAVLACIPDERRVLVAGREYGSGHLHGHEVVVVLSRIGKVAAATTATALIERFGIDRVIFTGAAGGLGQGVRVGDVVVASEFLQHDMDASPLFPRHEVPLYGRSAFPTDPALTARLAAAARQVLAEAGQTLGEDALVEFELASPQVHQGLVVSGDRFVATSAESDALRASLPAALAVEMEGAAVSDRADEAAHVDFLRFIECVASRYSQTMLDRFFASL